MVLLVVLLGLGWLCTPLGALAMDFSIKNRDGVQGYQKGSHCVFDDDCGTRKFCVKPRKETPFCATCRRTRRHCQHANMCCLGMLCVNNVCTLPEDAPPELERGTDRANQGKRRRKTNTEPPPPRQVQKKQRCLKNSDCKRGFCCIRHFQTKVCKPMLQEGHICSAKRHSFKPVRNMFQRFNCKAGLACRSQVAHRHYRRLHVCRKA